MLAAEWMCPAVGNRIVQDERINHFPSSTTQVPCCGEEPVAVVGAGVGHGGHSYHPKKTPQRDWGCCLPVPKPGLQVTAPALAVPYSSGTCTHGGGGYGG